MDYQIVNDILVWYEREFGIRCAIRTAERLAKNIEPLIAGDRVAEFIDHFLRNNGKITDHKYLREDSDYQLLKPEWTPIARALGRLKLMDNKAESKVVQKDLPVMYEVKNIHVITKDFSFTQEISTGYLIVQFITDRSGGSGGVAGVVAFPVYEHYQTMMYDFTEYGYLVVFGQKGHYARLSDRYEGEVYVNVTGKGSDGVYRYFEVPVWTNADLGTHVFENSIGIRPVMEKLPFRTAIAVKRAYLRGDYVKPLDVLTDEELLFARKIGKVRFGQIKKAIEELKQ